MIDIKALTAQAQEQKRELNIIGEVLAVKQEKFHEFVHGAQKFLEENRVIIEDTVQRGVGANRIQVITQLFRNMHTVKGNARTYGLLHLTHILHEAERTYDSLRKNDGIQWDAELLFEQLETARKAVEEYAYINEIKLARKGPGRRGSVDKFLMVEKQQISEALSFINGVDTSNVVALRDTLRQTRHHLELLGTESVEDALAVVFESLPSLAKELGKEAPIIRIASNDIMLHSQLAGVLKDVYMHLLRNSLDHGLESATERMAKGKSPAGHIHLSLFIQGDQLAMRLHDDGRGLALERIHMKALQANLIAANDALTSQEVANLILLPGFSTVSQVTEVSGRGVGMDAVSGFVRAEGGSLAINLLGAADGAAFCPFETLILLPGKFAVAPVLRLLQQVG